MQSLAVLWFQLQLAEQSLRDKNFAPANAEPTAIGTPRSDRREILGDEHVVRSAEYLADVRRRSTLATDR